MKNFLQETIKKILFEVDYDEFNQFDNLKEVVYFLQSLEGFELMSDFGTHGFPFHDKKNNVVFKLTNSKHEFELASKFKNKNLDSIVDIKQVLSFPWGFLIVRDYVDSLLSEEDAEAIAEESDDLYDFLNGKPETDQYENLTFSWKETKPHLLDFFKKLRQECRSVGVKSRNLDIVEGGIALNIGYINGEMKLFDF